MSTETQNNSDNQELDLSALSKKVNEFYEGILTKIFRIFLFFRRNIIWIGGLFVLGAGLGYFLDTNYKLYNNEIIVKPNFDSTDYLYSKIELISSKIKDNDTVFLKKVVGIKEPNKLSKIEAEPIIDVYKFINDSDKNFEFVKLLAEDGDIKKIVEESMTSKNYKYHMVTITTKDETSYESTVQPIMEYLNNSKYYASLQKEYLNNVKTKMNQNYATIAQIDSFLNTFSNTVNGTQKSDKLVYYNENSQLAEVIKTKGILTAELGELGIELVSLDKVVKENSVTLNIKNNKFVNGKLKLALPLLFVFVFIMTRYIRSFYKRQMAKLKN